MKLYTRIIALVLVMITALTLIACHEKGEIVMTVDGVEITSGLYLGFQLEAHNNFLNGVNEELKAQNATTGPEKYADYFNYSYQGKDAVTFIKEETLRLVKEYVYVEKKFDSYGLTLDKSDIDSINNNAKSSWENEKETYELNGVGYETFKLLATHDYKKNILFYYLYDKADESMPGSGSLAVSDEEVGAKVSEEYILAQTVALDVEVTEDATATDVKVQEAKTKLEDYLKKYNDGTSTFEEIYKALKEKDLSENVDDSASEEKTIYPKTAYLYTEQTEDTAVAAMYGMLKTKVAEEGFEYGKAYIIGGKDDAQVALVVVYDITKDPYYMALSRNYYLPDLRGDEFETNITNEAAKLQYVANEKLLKYYDPKNIDLDSVNSEE